MKKKKDKIIRQKDRPDKEIRRMLEVYTLVPPSPGTIKKKRRHDSKKISRSTEKK